MLNANIQWWEQHDSSLKEILENIKFRYLNDAVSCAPQIEYNNVDLVKWLQIDEIGYVASLLSMRDVVRVQANKVQKFIAKKYENLIVDGRDCGTVVFPDADKKIFLTASQNSRTSRLILRNEEQGCEYEKFSLVIDKLIMRDANDMHRKIAPLIPAFDSYIIDTSKMSLEETFNYIKKLVITR